jgi:hypothetical protein
MFLAAFKKAPSVLFSVIRSRKFFYAVVVLLVIQAIWFALVARYPMAFDEDFHFGIIKIYAHQWGPFITSTPPDSGAYGDLIRTPSYLYHYLMSFPYRLAASFTHDETIQIIVLRFLNVAMFASGLVVFRKLLRQLKFSDGSINLSLFVLVLVPVVPFLAGQINYDNLLFLLTPALGMAALTCARTLKEKGYIPASSLIYLISLGMLGSLVKYPFAPIFFAAVLYVLIAIWRHKKYKEVLKKTWHSFVASRLILQISLIVLLLISSGLFIERYGGNVVQYKTISPDCAQVESIDHCQDYGPWARNYKIQTGNGDEFLDQSNAGFLSFTVQWVYGLMHRLFFAISYDYVNYFELPLPVTAAYVFGTIGLILAGVYRKKLFRLHPHLLLAFLMTVIYIASLFYVNYSDFLKLNSFLAINGRYLIPVLLFMFVAFASAFSLAIAKRTSPKRALYTKFWLTVVILVFMLQGGGALTFAVRSDPDWYWQNSFSRGLGQGLKDISLPFIVGAGSKQNG